MSATTTHESAVAPKGLRTGALRLGSGVGLGIACAAPAYSLAASLGLIVVLVGEKAPAIMLVAFVPIFLIALAYRRLNRAEPDCGTTFTWAARAFGPRTGWLGGWVAAAACVIVMSNLAQIAGSYTFRLFGLDDLAESTLWVTLVGATWIVLMTWLSYRGIHLAARVQIALIAVEMLVLLVLTQLALVKVLSGDAVGRAATPEWSWFWPGGLGTTDLVDAVLVAMFIYWGWDTAVSVNEETERPRENPGRAAVLTMLLLVVTYVLVAFAAVAFAGTGEGGIGLANPENADDVFADLGTAIFGDNALGRVLEGLLLFSILTSAAASTQTTILPTARTALAMGAHGALPRQFAKVHRRYLTPGYATWAAGIASVGYYLLLTVVSSDLLADSIAATGLLIAFYYGLTGFACVWYHRRQLHGRDLWTTGVLPGLGGLMLLALFVLSAVDHATPSDDGTALFGLGGPFVVGVGALVLGGVLMAVQARFAPDFFSGRTLPRVAAAPASHPVSGAGPGRATPPAFDAVPPVAPPAGPGRAATAPPPGPPRPAPRRPQGDEEPAPEAVRRPHQLFDPRR